MNTNLDLWCIETPTRDEVAHSSSDEIPRKDWLNASVDKHVLNHESVLSRMLNTEVRYLSPSSESVYKHVQRDIKPHMRKILTTWMMETWEMLLLSKLKWDVSAVVATDYIDHLLARLHLIVYDKPVGARATVTLEDALRQHASTFVSLCATDANFSHKTPSSCLAAAARSLQWSDGVDVRHRLAEITGIVPDDIVSCVSRVEELLALHQFTIEAHVNQQKSNHSIPLATNHIIQNGADPALVKASKSNTVIVVAGQPETPIDVQDVLF